MIFNLLESLEKNRPNLALTRTSQKADSIQAELETKLNKILKQIKNMRFVDNIPEYKIKQDIGFEIKDLIQAHIEHAYLTGLAYTDKVLGKIYPLNDNDISNIKNITTHIENRFWGLVNQLEKEIKEFSFDLLASYINTLISDAITKAINQATLSELQPLNFQAQEQIQVEFVTRRDEKVCPICEPLDGNKYNLNDDKPIIPDSTHPNCRCRYLVIQDGQLAIG